MAHRYTGRPKKPGNAVLRCAALLPPLLALPAAMAALMILPLTQRFFLPPPETITELIAYSERQPEPEGSTLFDVEYHRDLLRRYHLDIYGPLSGTDGAGAAFTAASPVLLFHGDADRTVHMDQSVNYAEALNAAGGEAELVVWPGGNHAFLNYSDEQWFTQETVALEWMRQRLSVP